MKPVIICAAVTGNVKAKSKSPYHPVTPAEVAQAAVECASAGAAMVHIHGRHDDGTTSSDVPTYKNVIDRIVSTGCNAVLNLSAGDDGGKATHEIRWQVPDTGVEVVSLDVGSFNAGDRIYDNSPSYLRRMAEIMRESSVKPAIEVFDFGQLRNVQALIDAKLISAPYYIEFVFGGGGMPLDERLLPLLIDKLPEDTEWSLCCKTGDAELYQRFMMYAFTHGGHVRTGMEDVVHVRPGVLARSNAEMVEQWARMAEIWGRPLATAEEARQMLRIAPARTAAYLASRASALA